jgi:hypothetical protein
VIKQLVVEGELVNEVEGAGCTPLHAAAYQDWVEGIDLLVQLGAKVSSDWRVQLVWELIACPALQLML